MSRKLPGISPLLIGLNLLATRTSYGGHLVRYDDFYVYVMDVLCTI
jgi:hypothetical protein